MEFVQSCVICICLLKDKCETCEHALQTNVNSISLLCNTIKHVYHKFCIDGWLKQQMICPFFISFLINKNPIIL